ncbi:4011_t:CDS:2, partial [Ambispora leptoticha]
SANVLFLFDSSPQTSYLSVSETDNSVPVSPAATRRGARELRVYELYAATRRYGSSGAPYIVKLLLRLPGGYFLLSANVLFLFDSSPQTSYLSVSETDNSVPVSPAAARRQLI